VLATALELIDAGPPEAFSMRRLADALGIGAMTLYGYVANKDELIEGATLLALAEVHTEPDPAAPWHAHIRAAMREVHDVTRRHPNLAALVVGQRLQAPGIFRIRERVLGVLLEAGFEEGAALRALGVLSYFALGFAGGQAGLAASGGAPPELPADEFPHLTGLADRYAEHASDAAFEHGLDLLLDGLRAQLSRG
jgi:AcrR family transcriptional regulator